MFHVQPFHIFAFYFVLCCGLVDFLKSSVFCENYTGAQGPPLFFNKSPWIQFGRCGTRATRWASGSSYIIGVVTLIIPIPIYTAIYRGVYITPIHGWIRGPDL